ncbi:DMSO/selenate family reductase complex B subunit [uncultured Pseudodesulfovibrio sp.]|uniref:DMSO/selenate family reductase complex B subunit n=1 Tax=uncultured Pseudodesulfovibrio sp. TaxID=2035858 RepID=UPI0029C84C79|nr:DMSO/selenate family reductase complex B subunit [uncultured Pseudodesulfovibrio sp.]
MLKRPAFYIDMEACTGCKTCMIACIDKNDLPDGVLFRRVTEYAGGDWIQDKNGAYEQNIFAYYLSVSCNHCENPICVRSCPTTAMHKDENGIVIVDHDKCVGCRYCEWGCPYSAPQYNAKKGKMEKCDFCRDYLEQGKPPACVAACPTRALEFGEYEDLVAKHGASQVVAPLPDPSITYPNLIVSANRNAQPAGSRLGTIQNPEEV